MNRNKILSLNGFVVGILIVLFSQITVQSEVRSGFWTLVQPSGADSTKSHVDFSVLTSFCSTMGGSVKCSLKVTDCFFRNDSIIAPNGIYYDSSISAGLQSQFISGKTIKSDREALFYLDSMMKKSGLSAPPKAFVGSISSRSEAFFIKSSENRPAVMIKAGEYGGDIERTLYYWAYQPDSGATLFKNRIFNQQASLQIMPDVYSGRLNPVFILTDSAAIFEITHALYISMNTFLDPTLKANDTTGCPNKLGYRKLSILGMFEPDNPISSYAPTIDICGEKISYFQSSSSAPLRFVDKNSRLEKLIIRVCCEKNLTMTGTSGTERFCDVIPDSLKPSTQISHALKSQESNNPFFLSRQGFGKIRYRVCQAGRVRIDLLDFTGARCALLTDRCHEKGTYSIDVQATRSVTGAYLIRYSRPDVTSSDMVVPMVICK